MRQRLSDAIIHNFLDMALRYHPIVEWLRPRLDAGHRVLEVGSGPVGITPYLRRPVVGVDRTFGGPSSGLLVRCRADIVQLPFADRQFKAVLCVDVLEHLDHDVRRAAVREVLRCADRWAVLAFPSGSQAAARERELGELLRRRLGVQDRFLQEHLQKGLPELSDVLELIETVSGEIGRHFRAEVVGNVSLDSWRHVQRAKADILLRAVHIAAFPVFFWVLRRRNQEPCYRRILFLESV